MEYTEKDYLSDRVDNLKSTIVQTIVGKILEELAELIPDILTAIADGKISDEEKLHLEARVMEQLASMFGKKLTHESADKILAGITEVIKLVKS